MTETNDGQVTVVAVAITNGKQVLAAKRDQDRVLGGHWEYPGGKVEPGETNEVALVCEIEEELGATIRVGRRLGESVLGRIRVVLYVCKLESGSWPVALEHERSCVGSRRMNFTATAWYGLLPISLFTLWFKMFSGNCDVSRQQMNLPNKHIMQFLPTFTETCIK